LGQVRWAVLERNGRIGFIPADDEVPSIFSDG
jgi:uncharacterized membrane protein YcaP (DUF421 family)